MTDKFLQTASDFSIRLQERLLELLQLSSGIKGKRLSKQVQLKIESAIADVEKMRLCLELRQTVQTLKARNSQTEDTSNV